MANSIQHGVRPSSQRVDEPIPWLLAEGTLGGIRLAETMLPGVSVVEHRLGTANARGRGDLAFLDALRVGYSFQLYVGAILLAHGFWVRLHPLSVRPDTESGRSGSYSDQYDLLAGVHSQRGGEISQSDIEQRVLRMSGLSSERRAEPLGEGFLGAENGVVPFSVEVKARGQAFESRHDFPFDDLILEPENRFRNRAEKGRYPDVWGCVSQVTGQVIWLPSAHLGRSFCTKKQGRHYRTAPITSFVSTQELGDYLSLRNDTLGDDQFALQQG